VKLVGIKIFHFKSHYFGYNADDHLNYGS